MNLAPSIVVGIRFEYWSYECDQPWYSLPPRHGTVTAIAGENLFVVRMDDELEPEVLDALHIWPLDVRYNWELSAYMRGIAKMIGDEPTIIADEEDFA